jgi:predicted HTH domain antitoxin
MATTTSFQVALPNELLTILGAQPQAAESIKEFTILGLFQEGRLSAGKAAELLGLTLQGFAALLARKGIPYFRYDPQDWAQEVSAVRQWQAEHGTGHA